MRDDEEETTAFAKTGGLAGEMEKNGAMLGKIFSAQKKAPALWR